MSVYVDPPFVMESGEAQARRVGARHGHRWCHLFADSLDELHAMAKRVGMRPEWFQRDSSVPHYDLVPTRRAKAVQLGAIEVTRAEAVAIWRRLRGWPGV